MISGRLLSVLVASVVPFAHLPAAADEVADGEQRDEQPVSLRYLGKDAAIYHGVTRSRRAGALEGADERRVHSTFVLQRLDGDWRIVHHRISGTPARQSPTEMDDDAAPRHPPIGVSTGSIACATAQWAVVSL